jgi:hypothetical protein
MKLPNVREDMLLDDINFTNPTKNRMGTKVLRKSTQFWLHYMHLSC